jgi:hypothetical protein
MSDKPDYLVDVPAEYISADEYEAQEVVQQEQVVQITDWEQTMSQLAERKATSITIPRGAGFNRAPKEFFKLYAKLLPSQSTSSLGESTDIVIKHILPKSPLDE